MIPECVAQWGSSCWRRSASLVVALPKIGMLPLEPLACPIQRSNSNQSKYLWHRSIYWFAINLWFQAVLKVFLQTCLQSLWMQRCYHPSVTLLFIICGPSLVRYENAKDTVLSEIGYFPLIDWCKTSYWYPKLKKKHLPAIIIYLAVNSPVFWYFSCIFSHVKIANYVAGPSCKNCAHFPWYLFHGDV